MSYVLAALSLLVSLRLGAEERPLTVVSYNVENFFHPAHDTLTNDYEWTLEGARRWSFKRYNQKAENIARVLTTIGEWQGVDLVGLCEVENAKCLKKLCWLMQKDNLHFVHYESPDKRGIDVALLYRPERVDTLQTRTLHVDLQDETTRDILYVCARIGKKDTLHCFVCHMPSQRGGTAVSEWKRVAARKVLQQAVDSIFALSPQANILVMGDMNCAPSNNVNGLTNRMIDLPTTEIGSHKWQGQWSYLDQFYTSPSLTERSQVSVFAPEWILEPDKKFLGLRPKRCFNGYRYQNGYSDHLPVQLKIENK